MAFSMGLRVLRLRGLIALKAGMILVAAMGSGVGRDGVRQGQTNSIDVGWMFGVFGN